MKNAVTEIITAYEKLKPAGVGVIAIDGRAASGKTTLAAALAAETGGAVVHMDDFFLPAELRTPQRLAAPGGNVHAERFAEEVLPFLRQGRPFCYRRFDCHVMDYGNPAEIPAAPVIIVEGAYSLHPQFGRYADLTVFCDITPQEQQRRITRRNGEAVWPMFRDRWIPFEEAYFSVYPIRQTADLIL